MAGPNQRAEITAITIALEWALERYKELDSYLKLAVYIHSDSPYAIERMNTQI
ncbi:hypothetical protein GGR58DRAFT_506915 [Xylaria digitata]|nr:hypothetical protein GGR58DRAFT_506915 [Xylaria digitata]